MGRAETTGLGYELAGVAIRYPESDRVQIDCEDERTDCYR